MITVIEEVDKWGRQVKKVSINVQNISEISMATKKKQGYLKIILPDEILDDLMNDLMNIAMNRESENNVKYELQCINLDKVEE